MSDRDSSSGGMGVVGGIGAVVVAGAVGLARFGDDAVRIFGRHADGVGRTVMHGADDVGQGLAHHADDLGQGIARGGPEIGGIPKFRDPSVISRGADEVLQHRAHVPGSLLRPSTYGQGEAAQPQGDERK